jgi:hypothetical protein
VDAGDEALAELEVLVGFDDDLAGESTRVSNRIRGLLTQIHPPLERVLGPKVAHPAVLRSAVSAVRTRAATARTGPDDAFPVRRLGREMFRTYGDAGIGPVATVDG